MSDSIAERAAREITHYFLEPNRKTRMEQHIKPISAIVERAIAESQAPGLCEKNSPYHSPTSIYCLHCLPPDAPLGALLLSNRAATADDVKRGLEIAKLLDERRKAQGLPPEFVKSKLGDGEPSALLGICERGNHAPLYGSKKHRQPHSRLADCENWCEVPQKPSDYVTTRGPMINAGRVPAYSESGAAQEVSPPSLRPKMMWGWHIEEIKSALRMFQSKHPGKSPLEVERLLGEPT